MKRSEIQTLLDSVKFELFGKLFKIKLREDELYSKPVYNPLGWIKPEGRLYIQVFYYDECRNGGGLSEWHGRKWYLSDYMTEDEIVKTAYAACKATVEHEVMEGFTFDGKLVFNPHVNFRELLTVTDKEVRRS